MKVWIDTDERYPDYIVSTERDYYGEEIEVDQEALDRWGEAEHAYNQRADEIAAAMKAAKAKKRPMTKALLEERRKATE